MTPEQQKLVDAKLYTRQYERGLTRSHDLLEVIAEDYEEIARQRRSTYGSGDCIASVWDKAAQKIRSKAKGNS